MLLCDWQTSSRRELLHCYDPLAQPVWGPEPELAETTFKFDASGCVRMLIVAPCGSMAMPFKVMNWGETSCCTGFMVRLVTEGAAVVVAVDVDPPGVPSGNIWRSSTRWLVGSPM